MVVEKPAGLAVEPERWARRCDPCLSGALLQVRPRARERSRTETIEERMRLVHRLDKETSGAI